MKTIIITNLPQGENIILQVADINFHKALEIAEASVRNSKQEYDINNPDFTWQLDSMITDEWNSCGIKYSRHTHILTRNVQTLDESFDAYWIFFNPTNVNYMNKDAVEFLRGEAYTLELFASSEDAFYRYVEDNGLDESEDYAEGGYDLSNYNENTWAHIADQVDHRRGYDKQFADRIMDLIDAYYSGGSAYVENDVEAECHLLAGALIYVAGRLQGELDNE